MAHAAPAAHGRHHRRMAAPRTGDTTGALTRAVLLGLVYGVWAAYINRQQGPVDAGNVFYGILCGVLFAGIMYGLARVGPRMKREARATAYGAFGGIAVGYLNSLTDHSVLHSGWIGLVTGVGVGLVAYYRYYTREP
ncbi:hypothetical protein AB0953_01865 [Streptomyces sp. NPDC046866]|uniref:hypothetical protein n=1 Tax=Streptomyces sp. NPDC046866 TaxID=3154921 RepID=UPI0034572827